MPSAIRRLVGLLASRYQLTVTSKGKGATKHSVLARTKQTRIPVAPSSGTHIPTEDLIRSVISESGGRLKGNARPADRFDRGFPDKRHRKQKQSKAGTTVTTRLQNKGGGGRKTPASGRGKGGKGNKSGSRAPGTGNAGSAPNPAQPRIGTTVGEGSAPIGESNVGHRMLKALGWAPGQALGARGGTESGNGLINPVDVIVRGRRSGLGNAL
ncbi:uncharacterized protein EV422DRAFT_499367 [Fimicolochytrium jonesii]|uniref:uncharacterized protein n=1 Tax=Fimicolochytrium jonesii TaxID=1396493 RepID=UPI0022FE8F94|nr:uncharacterized protein EV422DRAFT_499367 [Fimicolochytrium jonesii]KAI8818144.1 hypothetical protein EV422DRAFT_499367 [Fimicolochytrium jonesii]